MALNRTLKEALAVSAKMICLKILHIFDILIFCYSQVCFVFIFSIVTADSLHNLNLKEV